MSLGTSDIVKERFESELVETVEPISKYTPATVSDVEVDEGQAVRLAHHGILNASVGYLIPAGTDTAIEHYKEYEREFTATASLALLILIGFIVLQYRKGNTSWLVNATQYLLGFLVFTTKYLSI